MDRSRRRMREIYMERERALSWISPGDEATHPTHTPDAGYGRTGGNEGGRTRRMELGRVRQGRNGGHVRVAGRDVLVDAGIGGVDLSGREGKGREER